MLKAPSYRFVLPRITAGVLVGVAAILFAPGGFVSFGGQSGQDSATTAAEAVDANSAKSSLSVPEPIKAVDTAEELTAEQLLAKKKEIIESQELSDELKAEIAKVYDRAVAQLKLSVDFEAKGKQYQQARKDVAGDLEKIKALLEGQPAVTTPQVAPEMTSELANEALNKARQALVEAENSADKWDDEPKRRAERRAKISEETTAASQELEEIKTRLSAPVADEQVTELTEAQRTLSIVRKRALENQIDANTEELLFYDESYDLLAARRNLATRQQADAEKLVEFWQSTVSDLRQKEADEAKEQAIRQKEETRYSHPVVRAIAEENARLAEVQADLVANSEALARYSESIDAKLAAVKKDFAEMQTKVELAGKVTGAMGMLLAGQRETLPAIRENRRRMQKRPSEISLAQFNRMQYDRQWSDLGDLADEIDAIVDQLDPSMGDTERDAIKKEAADYYESQRKILRTIQELYWDYSIKLASLDTKEREYVDTVQAYSDFIDANILWVKSSPALSLSDLRESVSAVRWLLSPSNWYRPLVRLGADLKGNLAAYLAVLPAIVGLIVLRPRARKAIDKLCERVHQVRTDSFSLTLKTLGLTVVLATFWPLLLFLLAWRVSVAGKGDDFSQALAFGLSPLVPTVFAFEFLRYFAMPCGLALGHLRMHHEPTSFFRRLLPWFFVPVIPIMFVIEFMRTQKENEQWHSAAGRLFFLANLLVVALFLLTLLRPSGPIMKPYLKHRQKTWLERLRYVWYPLCLILPATFGVLAAMGYFYAARQLHTNLVMTIILILLAIFARAMFVRWLTVAHRRLALWERLKRETAEREVQAEGTPSKTSDIQQGAGEDETPILKISRQTRRLIDEITLLLPLLGVWYVWSDVLPALGRLTRIELWSIGGDEVVTIGSVALALLVLALTVAVSRNLPGLLEISVLRWLPISRGVRFAIITLFRYTLVLVGIVLAFGEIGIGWSKVQWLAAAVTVGLGFGLQEIFANFVSGLIILFEQPIRVDDVVTIAEVTGKVSKIRIRATTIRGWDQRELVVPNKEFITGRLINWTLSDNILRREFAVGIAYGSDTAEAERILYEVARANPLVLDDPEPMVIFKAFGDNSLEFELRVYLAGMENYFTVWHGVNSAIDQEFRKAGIVIAFPQRDLHLRSAAPGLLFSAKGTEVDAGGQ